MAKLAFLFSIFLLFTFSHARFLTADETPADLPESDPESTTSILLPSQSHDFNHDDASKTGYRTGSLPLTRIRFQPVNRHFPRRPFFPFRHKHSCRYHKRFRPLNLRFHQKRFISYGNDMILSNYRSFDPESHGVVRQVEARWGSFHDDGSESKQHVDFMSHHHDHEDDHHHHHHDHDHDHDLDHEEDHHHHKEGQEREKHHQGGLMEKFRRFFIHF
ncbi:histidine-rich glycoprotein-like [Hibiscus syriacus]|uniref:histidine-rich glycoprotein-like n=1 Tax=Hibiscus syriacus TaxID=106335 RepID=UPI0019246C3D|nr:histidine-rich glycoprotein-like [Hibiscus syriacus]